ncbi:MAG: glycosyltransferase family 9 protein [Bacteroidota bacterium]
MSAVQEILDKLHARRLEKFLKHALSTFLGLFLSHERVTEVPLDTIRNILVIRQHNQLGDMLCAVPLLRALRQRLPEAHIVLVASPVNYEVMLHNPFVDEVILYNKFQFFRSPIHLVRFYRKLRARRYDLAVVPSTVSVSFTSDAMAYLCGARYRIGASSLNGVENIASRFFNLPVLAEWKPEASVHQTERNLEFVRCIGISTDDLSIVIRLTDEERKSADEFLRPHLAKNQIAIGFHPGAGKPQNRWPAEHFARVADRLASEIDALLVITAGPMDDEAVQQMVKNLRSSYLLVSGKGIREVAAIIDRLSLFVTNDTGVMHVAGATSTRVLALFGSSDPYQWAPRSQRHRFLVAPNRDIRSLTEEEVHDAAVEMIRGNKKSVWLAPPSQQSY